MENKDLKTLQKKVLKTKKDLKEWEAVFFNKYGRPPTVKDISERPNIEKFYKKYNQLKKELKQETIADSLRLDSQQSTQSPERIEQRRSSVEFVRSPSHPMGSRMKPSMFDKQSVNVRKLEFEEKKTFTLEKKVLTEDEAFWLDVPATPRTSSSQPLPSHSLFSQPDIPQTSSSQQPRLILGSSQPKRKKNLKQQKLFGRNPFQRALSSSQPMEEMTSPISPLPQSQPTLSHIMDDMIPDDDEEDDMEIEVVTHEIDPFRMYDPSLFHWEDPTFSIGPGFFSSASPCYLIPMLNEPTRRDRVLKKLEKGTLGEVLEENQCMEQDVDEDIRQFLSTHKDPNSLEAALTPIDENLLNATEYVYKKKPIQKRQTRLHKMKFVDTSSRR